jgi:hypothetical protein
MIADIREVIDLRDLESENYENYKNEETNHVYPSDQQSSSFSSYFVRKVKAN